MSFDKDTYRTPRYVFRWLEQRFAWFHLDGCANAKNALCQRWIGSGSEICEDFLADAIFDHLLDEVVEQGEMLRIFVNPPYSNPLPFVQRAAELRKAGYLVVMLLPADKSTKWYQVIQDNATEVIDIIGGRGICSRGGDGKHRIAEIPQWRAVRNRDQADPQPRLSSQGVRLF